MKINRLFIKVFILFTFLSTAIFASAKMSGALRSGDDVILKPQNDHALSITKTMGKYTPNSNYDFIMMNGLESIYEDKNQKDDIYLVFHDDVEAGDRIKIHVNSGYFDYRLTPLQALPTIVKNVIDPEVLERARVHEREKKKRKRAEKLRREKQKRIALSQKARQAKIERAEELQEISEPKREVYPNSNEISKPKIEEKSASTQSVVSESFFTRFTKIFKELVHTLSIAPITKTESKETKRIEEKVTSNKKIESKKTIAKKGIGENFDDSALRNVAQHKEKLPFISSQKGLGRTFDDSALKSHSRLEQNAFTKPRRGILEDFDESALKDAADVQKRDFTQLKSPEIEDAILPTALDKTFNGGAARAPKSYEENFSTKREQRPSFKQTSVPQSLAPSKIAQTLQKEEVPTFAKTQAPKPTEEAVVSMKPKEKAIYRGNKPTYPDTGYKKGYESLEQHPKVAKRVQKAAPLAPVVMDDTLPRHAKALKEDSDKRLVITKMIEKKEPKVDPYAGRVLGRMDDRVLGSGYHAGENSGKLGMRVTQNRKPVSAWVEVFKNGTKKRVKTFYTSKSRHIKKVKLPAGTYMVRATYRTRGSKQQKTIHNIHLKEGENVNKNIAFYDGKLRVIARRGDAPLYVKVVAYKSGTHRRVSYDFSSRTSGIAQLRLASGSYDIEVLEHDNSRLFEDIRIRGGQTNTINADF